ncbi:MAG: hypothetical protein MUO77_03635 [Anaerolineales bacterium]|nr:hypothetical protein [Anaerolineales bacterium]
MKREFLYVVSMLMIIVLAACGPAPTPTVSPMDLQNTAVALAWTEIAMTQAALPTATATPIPPTPTLTFTPFPTPTFQPLVIAPSATSSVDPCGLPIPSPVNGTKTKVKFVNESKGTVTLSFAMTQKNELGECGTYSFNMGESESPTEEVLTGCYTALAWITGKKPSIARSTNYICVDASATRGITITSEWIGID